MIASIDKGVIVGIYGWDDGGRASSSGKSPRISRRYSDSQRIKSNHSPGRNPCDYGQKRGWKIDS